MQPNDLIKQFCEIVNAGLEKGTDRGEEAEAHLRSTLQGCESDANYDLLCEAFDEVRHCYREAYQPTFFFNANVTEPGPGFDQCYFLLREILEKAVVGPKGHFADSLSPRPELAGLHPFIVIGRFWQVSGPQNYASTGRLLHFDYDPLVQTQGIASTISGDYMTLDSTTYVGEGIGTLGQMVTREGLRRGGHGSSVNRAFEQKVSQIAASRGEQVRLFLLEAEDRARQFWYNQGYRYPQGSHYVQPSIAYDPETGEGLFPEMTELIMIKPCRAEDAESIEIGLLLDTMKTMFENWYIPDYLSEAARQRVTDHVINRLLPDFAATLVTVEGRVPLVAPPLDQ
jgi:hypothetical protein